MIANVILVAALAAPAPTPRPTPTPTPPPPIAVLKHSGTAATPAGRSLADVARRTKLKTGSGVVISNDNLAELARGVELTESGTTAGEALPAAGSQRREEGGARAVWQERYQRARGRVLFLESEVERLEGEVARLQTQFYSWDDPAYRDGVIKPAWDKAVNDLAATREKLDRSRDLPDEVMTEARREGALPGWFRGLPDPQPVEDEVAPAATPVATPAE